MRPQPAGSRHPVSQPLLQARASLPPSLPQDTAFLLDLHLDLMAARADASPQLFCLASEILFILQGRLFCFFLKLGILTWPLPRIHLRCPLSHGILLLPLNVSFCGSFSLSRLSTMKLLPPGFYIGYQLSGRCLLDHEGQCQVPLAPCSCEHRVCHITGARSYISEQKDMESVHASTSLDPTFKWTPALMCKPLPSQVSHSLLPWGSGLSVFLGTLLSQVHITARYGGGWVCNPGNKRLKQEIGVELKASLHYIGRPCIPHQDPKNCTLDITYSPSSSPTLLLLFTFLVRAREATPGLRH